MKIPKVDPEKCEGCGNCEAICPEVFMIKDDDNVHTSSPTTSAGWRAASRPPWRTAPRMPSPIEEE